MNRLRSARGPQGARHQALWRLHPERWLESLVTREVSTVDERLDHGCLYSQVPAFSASDRAMLDVLTTTRDNRLAVVELKADEDIHLPLQGLDYWARVERHHARRVPAVRVFSRARAILAEPLLFLVAPTLHIHPATDTVLHYFAPEIDWTLVGIDERWRDGVRVIFRKASESSICDTEAQRHGGSYVVTFGSVGENISAVQALDGHSMPFDSVRRLTDAIQQKSAMANWRSAISLVLPISQQSS